MRIWRRRCSSKPTPIARRLLAAVACLSLTVPACSSHEHESTKTYRGQVLDQDTGQPIAGAIVVGLYLGSRGLSGATSCNGAESAVSDEHGWYSLPLDETKQPPMLSAYKTGYGFGRSTRMARCSALDSCRIARFQWNETNTRGSIIEIEKETYKNYQEAVLASKERETVYLKSLSSREERLFEIYRLALTTSCGAKPKVSQGRVPMLEAILDEEENLRASEDVIRATRLQLKLARTLAEREK